MSENQLKNLLPVTYDIVARGILEKKVKAVLRERIMGASDQTIDQIAAAISKANHLRHKVGDRVVVNFYESGSGSEQPTCSRPLKTELYRGGELIGTFTSLIKMPVV